MTKQKPYHTKRQKSSDNRQQQTSTTIERTNLTEVKVYNLPASSLAYQISMAAHVVAAVRQGYSMQHALSTIKIEDTARPNVQRLSFDTMRHWGCTHFWLTRFIPNAPTIWVQALLCVALTQLRLETKDSFILVDQTVDAAENFKPHAKGLVNAILRKFLREQEQWESLIKDNLEATYNYPLWWINAVKAEYPNQWQSILTVGNTHPPMTLRVNKQQQTTSTYLSLLHTQDIGAKLVPNSEAIILDAPCHVTALPHFFDGAVSIQDTAAQHAAKLLDLYDGLRVLDACAAPGGKTGHILEQYNVDLTALEKDEIRAQRITENLNRLKLKAKVVVCDANNAHLWWDKKPYDRILLDAPCSASGIVRRHPDIRWLRNPDDLSGLAQQQMQLLRTMWQVLAIGGRLLYCTCSIFKSEGEDIIGLFIKNNTNAQRVELPITQLLPQTNDNNHDGFFYAALIKTA